MNVFFSGIGGVGIGPLAEIAADAGFRVQGSDTTESLVTKELQNRGITVEIGQDGSFLQSAHNDSPIDWFVYTAALPEDHPELVLARQLGIKTAKRDELLAYIIEEKNLKLIAVAGTHGKTTTTGMLVWTLQQLGVPVSYAVGTTLGFGPSGKFDPASEYFIYECDEFDRNFLQFSAYLSLVTSIDYDHPDTYPTEKSYLDAFQEFGNKSQQLIAWQSQHSELFANHPDAWLLDTSINVKLAGDHNRHNATLVVKAIEKLASELENSFDKTSTARVSPVAYTREAWREAVLSNSVVEIASKTVETFPGTDRRFEKLTDNLYSDYGHHPVEIAATLQLARELSDHVVLVYQPHQNVRQHEIKDQYTDQFELADEIYWLPTYLSREDPNQSILSPEELTSNITNKNSVRIAELDNELWSNIQKARNNGKLVLGMGAGTIDGWLRDKLAV